MNTTQLRHQLHTHPGISGDEWFAHDLVVRELQACHPDRVETHVGGFGVVAVWGSELSRPTIAIRGDMDAIPLGHRCGHDGHTAILLQLAAYLGAQGYPADRNVMLVFQPEEETGMGAQKILEAGIMQQYNIHAVYGLHNLPGYPLGTVVLNYRTFAAASSGVVYRLTGRSTHASTPEKGINPGLAVAEIIQQFARFNSDPHADIDAFRQSTLICTQLGEEAFGTSAGEALVMFTLRAFTNHTMEHLLAEAHDVAARIASRYGLHLEYELREPFPATENRYECVEQVEQYCECRTHTEFAPFRWSEDFAHYLIHFRGAMFGIGAGEKHVELHHPDYDFPDALIGRAAEVFYNLVNAPLLH